MLKIKKGEIDKLKEFGFKYGSRERIIYKTKCNGLEAEIYIDLQPCHNNGNELKVNFHSFLMPEKIADKLYDLIKANLVVKE